MGTKGSTNEGSDPQVYDFQEELSKRQSVADHFTISEKNELIVEHRERGQKIACSILRKWGCRLELEEVESVVDLSLCEAVKHFDPKKGVSFVTFLFYHLRGNLIRTINAQANRPSVPLEFTDDNLESGFIGKDRINPADVIEIFGGTKNILPEDVCEHNQMYGIAKQACESLTDLEKKIIFNIYLYEDQVTKLAKDLNYSRCHISRLKTSAIKKIRAEVVRLTGEEIDIEKNLPETGNRRGAKKASQIKAKNKSKKLKQVA